VAFIHRHAQAGCRGRHEDAHGAAAQADRHGPPLRIGDSQRAGGVRADRQRSAGHPELPWLCVVRRRGQRGVGREPGERGVGAVAAECSGIVQAGPLVRDRAGRPQLCHDRRAFTGQAPPGVSFPKADCAYWMSLWPGAHTCATAQMLEASSDAVVLRAGAGVMGAALLVAYGVVRYVQRRRRQGPVVVLAGYFPLLAAGVFGAGALGLALAQLTGFGITQGPGTYLSGAIVAAAAAAWYGRQARPAIRHLMRAWARYADAR
jgi:hypothetical protein